MQGVIAAVPTPVDEAYHPIKEAFVEHCNWALANGCDGLNILGSTGEANSFPAGARREVMAWAAAGVPVAKLMVGTGTPSLGETIALTEHADDLGYGVALVLPPYYYKPATDAGLIAWYMALHEALGDRAIQVYFYNFPQMTGINIPVEVIAELARRAPERFAGIKDSSGDLEYCRAIVAANGDLKVFPSSETALESAAQDGFAGCISASVNITCALAGRIWAERDRTSCRSLRPDCRASGRHCRADADSGDQASGLCAYGERRLAAGVAALHRSGPGGGCGVGSCSDRLITDCLRSSLTRF